MKTLSQRVSTLKRRILRAKEREERLEAKLPARYALIYRVVSASLSKRGSR